MKIKGKLGQKRIGRARGSMRLIRIRNWKMMKTRRENEEKAKTTQDKS